MQDFDGNPMEKRGESKSKMNEAGRKVTKGYKIGLFPATIISVYLSIYLSIYIYNIHIYIYITATIISVYLSIYLSIYI